ncbi:hypothetical protein MAR_027795, partial [Mya arenaria]
KRAIGVDYTILYGPIIFANTDRYEAKYDDPRANPHSSQYDPKFDPYVPMPAYHRFPQPVYRNYDDPRYQQQQQQQQQQHQQYQPQQPQQRQPPPYDNRDFNSPYYSQSSPRPEDPNMPRAGLATNYNTRITDLLTSIRDPVVKDHSLRRSMEVHKGYLVMMRVAPRSLAEVINAVQSNVSSIAAFEGYCLGFAEPCLDNTREIHMSSQRYHQEKNNGKVKVLKSSYAVTQDPWWEPRDSRRSPRFATVAFWFKDAVSANKCFESVGRFRQPDFPDCNRPQIVAVPLTYGKDMETPFDPEPQHEQMLANLSRYSEPVMVGFTLQKIRGTNRV